MRIVAGAWRGRRLIAPEGTTTRPTSDRVRQALFDMLLHAPWGGRALIQGAHVVDAFAGTGAFGLEALSRGAAEAVFFETGRAARAALLANIAACHAEAHTTVLGDVLHPPQGRAAGIVFLDPPYGQGLVGRGVAALATAGWIGAGTLLIAETGRDEPPPAPPLADRAHGAARLWIWRAD